MKIKTGNSYDVIIVGASYSGLAAAMALGRAMRNVLIIDDGKPCNRQTPFSHNFLTNDGRSPAGIAALAIAEVSRYKTVYFFTSLAVAGVKTNNGFEIQVSSGETFSAKKLIFATGIKDMLPPIDGFAACWGISVLHCPYCHGYEAVNQKTGILSNGDAGFDIARLISNWTNDLTLFTNGQTTLTGEQITKLESRHIKIADTPIVRLEQLNGQLQHIVFKDSTTAPLQVLYAPTPFEQHSTIPQSLGCALTDDGYIAVDTFQETSAAGIYASGDNASRIRTVANAVATGTTAGIAASKKIIMETF